MKGQFLPVTCLTDVIPQGLEGILVIGLGASADRDAMTLVRMQPDLQNQGYAVGTAAAMAVLRARGKVRDVDIKALQRELVRKNCLENRVLGSWIPFR